ncbi:hypothetical protein EUTSA_v10005743mg [Eutrema salsugineum]|uniref:Uncharacterized protein n=1 Tax=Eutrema salsugineum TaxID=72664 RepID=V4LPL8_EUTSA|nr:uncharacterized protein LOC18020015 [Eutrema salsugineum]ESQ44442.1 hypothetical protein EUTSA_v10005743mg [Eutrema salsugineum]
MMKKKKQSRSQSSTEKNPKKTLEPSSDSSPSPRLLSIFRSKLASGKDLKHMFRGMRGKTAPGLSSQSRIVRCPKCHKLLQEPIDATIYKCSGCDSILQAKRWELEGNDNSIPEALFSSQNHSLSNEVGSAEGGSKTPMRSTHRRVSPSVERGYHSETVYKNETSNIRREWMRRADDFSVTGGDSDMFASARSSPYHSRSNASEWTQHEGRYEEPPRVPYYPASPSPSSSAYEYGYSSPFHGSQVSASEQSYYHYQPNHFKQYGREGWFQESSVASPIRFPGETSDGRYYQGSSQSQLHDLQYHNLYESSSSATPHRSVYSERSYQAATYSEHSRGVSKSETSSEKSSLKDKKKYIRKRNPVMKRHVLPTAGGAPFATCSYCLELLQLPQVSLLGKHKRYEVRCGSCAGVLKFSVREKTETVLDSPNFVGSGTGFADETLTINQDSASEGREEIFPDDSHLSSSDSGSGDRICKSTDAVILRQNLETFEDKGIIKEDIRIISSKFLDSESEALQPQWKPSPNHKLKKQQPESSESIGETSQIHVEQSEEAWSEKSAEMDDNIVERVGCDLKESGYEKNEPKEIFGNGSGESLEVPVYKNERMSYSSSEAETVAERLVFHGEEPANKNEHVSETCVFFENTRDTQEFDWVDTQENKEHGGERKWEDIMGDTEDSFCDSGSSNVEIFEDTSVNEDTKHISNKFSDAKPATPQSPLKSLVNERFIGDSDQSGKATVTTSSIHEEQSKYEYENLNERQESDKTISDRVMSELEESRYDTNETLEPGKVSEDGSVLSLTKESETFKTSIEGETGEKRSESHQMDSPNEYVENSNDTLEPVCLEGSGYAGERAWEETMEDRAGLHLEEYESNYENYSKPLEWTSERAPTFHMHEYELGTICGPEEDADGRSESSSKGSFSDHGSSEKSVRTQANKEDQSQYEYENSSEREVLSYTVFDIVRSELQECRYETNETFEQGNMVGVEASETIIGETSEDRSVSHQMAPQNDNVQNSYRTMEPVYLEETMRDEAGLQSKEYQNNSHEWTSERAPTFCLRKYELWTIPEPEDDADGRSISSSTDFFHDRESLKERDVAYEEEPWLADENKTEELKVGVVVEDGPTFHLEKCRNDSTKLEEIVEWTVRTPTFRPHESELGTMLEPNEDADGRSETSSTGSFNNHESSKARAVFHEEEPQLVSDSRTEDLQVREITEDWVSLDLDKGENESMKVDETFEWTSERALTFSRREYELGTMLDLDKDANGRAETSFRGSFNDRGSSKERAVIHKDEPWLVDDYETKAVKAGVMVEDRPSMHLKKCENEKMELDQRFEPRDDIFRLNLDDTLEQEKMIFHLEMSQNKQENLRQTFKHGEAEEDIPEFGSSVSSEGHESPRKMAEVYNEAEEEMLTDHLENLQQEKEKSGLTSEPYAHFYNTTEPSEIVGLRHALYQTSPLRSPLSSPIHTPIGSPLHYLMASPMRSPIASPMHSHIVSPLRSPIHTSGSLSDVLFFGKKV